MIEDFKNICLKKHIQYLTILLLGMFVAAVIEMIGLASIPMFIMIIIDIDILINKYPDFFANDYIVSLEQNYITIFGGTILILIFVIKNIYLSLFLFFQGKVIKILRTDVRNKLFKKYINAPYNFHIKNNPSVLIRNLTQSVNGTINTIMGTLSITRESLILIVIFVLLFLNEPMVSISVFSVLMLVAGTFMFFTRRTLLSRGERVQLLRADQLKTLEHTLLYIQPSDIEGLSPMILQVLGMGVPLLCSDIKENLYLVKDEAITFKKSNVSDLYNKLIYCLDNKREIMLNAKDAAKRIKREYNWDDIAKKHNLNLEIKLLRLLKCKKRKKNILYPNHILKKKKRCVVDHLVVGGLSTI